MQGPHENIWQFCPYWAIAVVQPYNPLPTFTEETQAKHNGIKNDISWMGIW